MQPARSQNAPESNQSVTHLYNMEPPNIWRPKNETTTLISCDQKHSFTRYSLPLEVSQKLSWRVLGGSLHARTARSSIRILIVKKIACSVTKRSFGLREVGPSRKILHARGVGSERRKRVTRVVGSWGALGATRKIKINIYELHFLPLRGPLFLADRMRTVITIFNFMDFVKTHFMRSNMEIRIVFLRPWVAQKHSQIAKNR